ncbi:MAG: chromate transporter [Acidaminococcus sp.]|jgi:chromate transporter|nr:chromate transporter [Acidaminococcus sp.]MCI2101032.1 chromate transporter [Acidaminococcus sp.]MCI2116630.1 chromate transporter [Acidaminococcus sp.]
MEELKKLWNLFWVFAQVGVTTFGGGYAMLSILQREIVEKRHWASEEELMDYYAIGQCTPGVIAINTATFIGSKLYGISGGIIATLGVIFPSILIITAIAVFLVNFASLAIVKHAFNGIRACVTVLIFDSAIKLGKKSLKDNICRVIFFVVLAFALFTDVPTVLLIVLAGVTGYFVCPDFRSKSAKPNDSASLKGTESARKEVQ